MVDNCYNTAYQYDLILVPLSRETYILFHYSIF